MFKNAVATVSIIGRASFGTETSSPTCSLILRIGVERAKILIWPIVSKKATAVATSVFESTGNSDEDLSRIRRSGSLRINHKGWLKDNWFG